MKKFMEVIKANKGTILKRGLIALGAVVGLTVASKVLMAKNTGLEEDVSLGEEVIEPENDSDSEEENEE